MTYIELINNFWELDETWQFSCCETRLYFYLLKTANRLGWENNWTHSDEKTAANVGVSKNSFKTARNRLCQAGLIQFKEGGKGYANKTRYQISCQNLTPKPYPKVTPKVPPKPYPKVPPLINKTKIKTKNEEKNNKKNHEVEVLENAKVEFEKFRKKYPGMKRGLDTEFENFKRKNPDGYKEISFVLCDALDRLIEWRSEKQAAGQFVPEWANLQTWINQRRWEVELEKINYGNSKQTNSQNSLTNEDLRRSIATGLARGIEEKQRGGI